MNLQRELAQLQQRLLNLFAGVHLHAIRDDGELQTAQLQIRSGAPDGIEEVIDAAARVGEYGFASCPPDGAEAVALFLGGRRSGPVIIATGHRASRLKGLQSGEAALYNGVSGKHVKLRQDGVCHLNGDALFDGTATAEHVIPQDGATGVFTTQDGKTVTVTHGIITRIV